MKISIMYPELLFKASKFQKQASCFGEPHGAIYSIKIKIDQYSEQA